MNNQDSKLINSIFMKLKSYKSKGINIERKDVEQFFNLLINKN